MQFYKKIPGYKKLNITVENFILTKCNEYNISKTEMRILLNWSNIVGKDIAQISRPEKLSFLQNSNSGTLHLIVNHGGNAIHIQYAIPIIIEKISVYLGFKAVFNIKIKQKI
ncbi:DUF721 domain-containing protein [Neoehrlichia mikurensis]|uniref:DUF721 domain-containing protein n=1 Tax=Neoehrlichia mikurensis TaxID=89586 RepID=A0A9Q9BS28_9RICK|nr:DUF721 domain-containing protein [Neoehrlichia mikurensis]QXK92017.1 DUF721 domain-containing protein [Neoehrlichia mikurensis]QXK92475.1 DUF721 domain-containing protein [Neoehrlichia mikurensis]QXK93710.1 DUF721 domain-containing protein [Neoehrlichia mikurensis]UTO55317.1 DUF721 domain-containing protein [Neoehrlichia mikurensis]UTO56237.1 DUF721 domain-containing protein [Neoehrlichia mikurensis]